MLTYFWNANSGVFCNKKTGVTVNLGHHGLSFTGSEQEWWECCAETVNDLLMNHYEVDKLTDPILRGVHIESHPDNTKWLSGCRLMKEISLRSEHVWGDLIAIFDGSGQIGFVQVIR